MSEHISARVDIAEKVTLRMAKGGGSYFQVYALDRDEAIAWRDALNEAFPKDEVTNE